MVELSEEEREEARERQQAEIEFIQSAYSPEEAYVLDGTKIVRLLLLPIAIDDGDGGVCNEVVKVELLFEMPESYPVHEEAILSVKGSLKSSPSNPQYIRKAALYVIPNLLDKCQQTAMDVAGMEAVFSVLSAVEEWVESEWQSILDDHKRTPSNTKSLHTQSAQPSSDINKNILGRRIIYSHHIIAKSKRRGLSQLASQYKLGGFAKIGWPGVILIEGSETNCQLFVDEIKRWRWQNLQVRGEEKLAIREGEDMESHRKLPLQFEEIGEDGMSLLASKCREAKMEHLFLTCMKISDHRTTDDEGEANVNMNESEESYGTLVHVDHMNDSKKYRKWLKKTCQSQGCLLLIRQCRLGRQADTGNINRLTNVYVGIFGNRDSVKQVMKQWRTSRVDVDSKSKPCLERLMTVVEEGYIQRTPIFIEDESDEIDCTVEELGKLVGVIDTDWGLMRRYSDDRENDEALTIRGGGEEVNAKAVKEPMMRQEEDKASTAKCGYITFLVSNVFFIVFLLWAFLPEQIILEYM